MEDIVHRVGDFYVLYILATRLLAPDSSLGRVQYHICSVVRRMLTSS